MAVKSVRAFQRHSSGRRARVSRSLSWSHSFYSARKPRTRWLFPRSPSSRQWQVTSFQAVSDWQFNSAMTTGNFRATLNALMLWRARKDPAQNRKAFLATGSICLFFTLGALCGGICSRFCPRQALLALHLGNHHRCGRRKDTVIVPVLSTRKGLQTIFTKRQNNAEQLPWRPTKVKK